MELQPIDPETAVELYLADREPELASITMKSHRSRLRFFVEWCDDRGIDNLNELTGRKLNEYRLWRRIDGVPQDLHQKVRSPAVGREEGSRDVMLDSEAVEDVLTYLETYEYASAGHVTLSLLWHTMMRRGAAHGLDVDDYHPEDRGLEVVHRPETDTPIKNGKRGERLVALSGNLCNLLDDWIRERRPDVEDDHGRRPLLASAQGRLARSTIGKYCYRWTRPCMYGQGCPHDRNPDTCEAVDSVQASKCPSSVSPHPFRRGSITHHLNKDVPETAVGDRANVSQDILDKHYDQRTKREKMEQRRQYLDNI